MTSVRHAPDCSNLRCRGGICNREPRKTKFLQLRTEPTKEAHCPSCLLTDSYLQQRKDSFECSRVECPKRTPASTLMNWGKP